MPGVQMMILKVINLDQISKKVSVIENKKIGDVQDVSHGTLYYDKSGKMKTFQRRLHIIN